MFVSRCNLDVLEDAPTRVFDIACVGAGVEAVVLLPPGCFRFFEGPGAVACVEKVDMPGNGSLGAGTPLVVAALALTLANPFCAGTTLGSSCAPDRAGVEVCAVAFFGFDFGILPAASISRSSSRSSA